MAISSGTTTLFFATINFFVTSPIPYPIPQSLAYFNASTEMSDEALNAESRLNRHKRDVCRVEERGDYVAERAPLRLATLILKVARARGQGGRERRHGKGG